MYLASSNRLIFPFTQKYDDINSPFYGHLFITHDFLLFSR